MTLSICIATLPERKEQLDHLVAFLRTQGPFELVTDASPRGTLSVGRKRELMNQRATGDYIVHIDDDDWVSPTYIPDILQAAEGRPDFIGGYELIEGLSQVPQMGMWTNRAPRWIHGSPAKAYKVDYVRTPGHKTPIIATIAKSIEYRDMGFGEDEDYSRRLKASGAIKIEAFIPKVLQHYRYIPKGRDQYA